MFVAIVGVVMVYTATKGSLLAQGDDPKAFLKKQALFVVLGVIAMVVVALFDYRRLEPVAKVLYGLIVLALLGVFVIGSQCAGRGPLVQPGPVAAATIRIRRAGADPGRGGLLRPANRRGVGLERRLPAADLAGIPIVLVLVQPDLGTAMIMLMVLLVMLAVAGLPIRILVMLLVGVGAGGLGGGGRRPPPPLPDRPA